MAGCISPFLLAGVQIIISLHSAIFAGIPSIKTVENSGAEPPGMYNPIFSIGVCFCQQNTPEVVCILFSSSNCSVWKVLMLRLACSMACLSNGEILFSDSFISASETRKFSGA